MAQALTEENEAIATESKQAFEYLTVTQSVFNGSIQLRTIVLPILAVFVGLFVVVYAIGMKRKRSYINKRMSMMWRWATGGISSVSMVVALSRKPSRHHLSNGVAPKPVIGGSGGRSDGGIAVVKKEYAGTGVFLLEDTVMIYLN
ncbi:hypothetical protein L2E82_13260 [Cichorium intybus]|uniref:Uncharacterized protein n=1 Tax=Cichorium intybus TaxID=13427 RepID=A0ACB9GJD0_CICIN|nr:hypothetical protein L2E82_13260 [Cichorium intybus]